MSNDGAVADSSVPVEWDEISSGKVESPLAWTGPYVECKLEHPALEPTCLGDQFFPDSVPYETDGEKRVFYWRSRLPDVLPAQDCWAGLCATTHELQSVTHSTVHRPTLSQSWDEETELVVDGTIVGDSKTALVSSYECPGTEIRAISPDEVVVVADGETRVVPVGNRERIELSERSIETKHGSTIPTTPELVVRYPGIRTVYHPAVGSEYCLFPSFGIELAEIPESIAVPTNWGELDHDTLATMFGIDITSRPYPERILWQAFAHAAFDPNTQGSVSLIQFSSGHIGVQNATL